MVAPPPPSSLPSDPRVARLRRYSSPLVVAVSLALAGCERLESRPAGHLAELTASGVPRRFEPRLTVSDRADSCLPPDGTSDLVPRSRCAGEALPSPRLAGIASRASSAAERLDEEAMHATALIDLIWSDGAGRTLDRSISHLETVARLTERSAAVLADLSAAYLLRAERRQEPMDLHRAMEMAERALEIEPDQRVALFNLALAAERVGLRDQAARGWAAYLDVDGTSAWAGEARARLAASGSAEVRRSALDPAADSLSPASLRPRDALTARLHGWERLLPAWGAAHLAGDRALSAERLAEAEALGLALVRMGGDGTLASAVQAIRAAQGDSVRLRLLARAHERYGVAKAAAAATNHAAARTDLERLLAIGAASPILETWSRLHYATSLASAGETGAAEAQLAGVRESIDAGRHPALAGTGRWIAATIHLRGGDYERSMAAASEAAAHFAAAHEEEYAGGAAYVAADAAFQMAAGPLAYEHAQRALRTLQGYRASPWLHNLLSVTAEAAAREGLPRAALRIQEEGVGAAERLGQPVYVVEARLGRARLLAERGDREAAAAEAVELAGRIAALEPDFARAWFTAEGDVLRSVSSSGGEVRPAELESAAAFFAGIGNAPRHLAALVALAELRLARGDAAGAAADLERATTLLHEQRRMAATAALGSRLVDSMRELFDRLVMLRLAEGDPGGALDALRRARGTIGTGPEPARPPPGTTALSYALVGDTLLIWAADSGGVTLSRGTVAAAELRRTIARARAGLEIAAPAGADADLQRLHQLLVGPVRSRLGPPGTRLLVSADGEIAGAPFAALRAADGRFLVEDHVLVFSAGMDGGARAGARARPDSPVLVVADPRFDRAAYAGLAPLPGASAEAVEVARMYPRATVLEGPAATGAAVAARLPGAGLLHFAGHAVFDDARPERSYLLLASGGAAHDERLTASRLATLDLRSLRLVVLSACETIPSQASRSGGFAGLAEALLGAGAGGVVGSLWRVEDDATRELMVRFHQEYARDGDAAAALQSAQLAMLRSDDPRHRSPAAWAAFRFASR